MKIRSVKSNSRKNEFLLTTYSGAEYSFPFSRTVPKPGTRDRVESVWVDKELDKEAITYVLESGAEGSVHIEHVLEYNEDPRFLADLLTYKLSLEAQKYLEHSELSLRQLAKQLKTSVPQLYRLLDPSNTNKSMSQLVTLLHILECDVDVIVRKKSAA